MNSSTVLEYLKSLSTDEKSLVRDGSLALNFGAIEIVDRRHIGMLKDVCKTLEVQISFATRPDVFGVQLTTYAYIEN